MKENTVRAKIDVSEYFKPLLKKIIDDFVPEKLDLSNKKILLEDLIDCLKNENVNYEIDIKIEK